MRCSATPAVVMGLSWFTQRADGFIVSPPRGSSNQRTSTAGTASLSQHQPHITLSTKLSTAEAKRSLVVGSAAQLEARRTRKSIVTMSAGSQENEAKWEQTPKAMSGSDPEEMMRQMSIPDLVQKLQMAESTFGQVHPQVASALIPLSQALYANGDLGPARESCTRALKILQVAFGPSPRVETAECLHTMAMIQQAESPQVGDTALGSQNMALELAMRVCGPDSIEVAAYSRCLAQMSEDYAKYLAPGLPRPFYMPNPVPLYRQTLSILEKLIGPNDPEVASSLDDLASALLFWRDDEYTEVKAVTLLPEAETLAARSLAISGAALGPDHPMTAGRQHNLGMVKRGMGREQDARENFRRALEIREKTLGADHPDTKFSRDLAEGKDGGLVEPEP